MHREIDMPGEQRLLDFLGEQALAADLGEPPILHPVAGRANSHHLDRARRGEIGVKGHQTTAYQTGLAQRHRAATRSYAQRQGQHGLFLVCSSSAARKDQHSTWAEIAVSAPGGQASVLPYPANDLGNRTSSPELPVLRLHAVGEIEI